MPRRYSSYGRRGGYKSYPRPPYRKKPRMASIKKKVVGTAIRAATNRYTTPQMCKDLGTLWPGCITVKLKQHFNQPLNTSAGSIVPSANYQAYIDVYPYQPFVNFGSTVTGYTSVIHQPAGINRLINTSGTANTGIYTRMCCLRCDFDYMLDIHGYTVGPPMSNGSAPYQTLPQSTHYVRQFDNSTALGTKATTQAILDVVCEQGSGVQYREMAVGPSMLNATATVGNTTVVAGCNKSQRWKYSVFPHKLLDLPFDQYVANETSFGSATALPSDYAKVEIGGFVNNTINNGTANLLQFMRGTATWTVLFKDVNAAIV